MKRILTLSQNWAKEKREWPPPRTRCTINLRFGMRTNGVLVFLALLLFLVRYTQGQGPGPHAAGLTMRSREADMRVQFEIEEGQPPGTVVGTIPTKPNFTYRFNERPPEFLLNGTTGVITTAMEIDREMLATERFDFVILSSQPTYPLEVRIVILDINDNSPYFPEPSIEVSFSESANIGTRVILDTATDRDVGINDVNTDYKIVFSGNFFDDGKFRLVVTTNPSGETPYLHLETTGRLDREIKSFYQLNISAQDGGNPPRFGYLLVNITVLDVNDNPPIFDHSDYSVSLNESVPPGTSVLQVRGTDNDIGDNAKITYFLSDTESQFTVDPQTGVISTLEVLKCQQNCPTQGKCPKSCVFTVFARDHGIPRQDGRAYVTVNLLDANDHDPSIRFRFFPSTASYATVDENAQNGSVVAAVSVIDLDEGPNGETWVEIQGGNELGHFRLESTPSFDIVRVNGILDREQIGKYNLTITATDRGIPPRSSTAFLIIHVNDVNDHEPVFEKNEYSAVLGEMVPIGTYVVGISATDDDTGVNSDIFYAIVSGNDRRWFDIDVHTGLVTTSHALNREDQDYVELKISARDGGPNPRWTYTYLRIQIFDENDEAPAFAEHFMNVTLIESAPPNSLVAVVTAVDNDLGTNGSVEYSFHPDVERLYPKKFFLDSTYGRLTLREELDREEQEIYTVVIVAKDQGTPSLSSSVTVRIIVLDVNDNKPYFYPKQYFYNIRSSDTIGTAVARLTATDADVGKNAQFLFSLVNGGEGKFEIDEITGIVKTKMHFSKREMSKYEIFVSVRNPDDRKMTDEAVIYVYVGDNQYRTIQFDHSKGYSFVLEEDMKNAEPSLGREAGRVSVSRSVRSGIKYSIVDGDPEEWFQIEESLGIISTSRSIDREMQAKFSLVIVAYDFLGFAQTTVNITITDLNDFPPTFEYPKGPIRIKEDWPVGHEVYLVKAYDMDVGHNGKIEYAMSTQPHNTFYIDKNSGMIYLNRPVRFEVGSQYEVTVTARDLGIPSLYSKLDLVVIIEDVNDRTPVFDHVAYETSLLESVPVNDRFFLLRATDADYGVNKQLTYTITVGNDENRFGIFPDGYLYVKRPLDREKRDFYSLTVTAQDNGEVSRSSSVNIVIHIIDENDNSPTFDNKTFQFFIAENEPPDTYVGKLSAEDLDKGRNAELTYMITNTQSDFMINPKTGFIRTLRYFDREQLVEASGHDYLVMDAVVMDGSVTRLRDEAKITIYITDVNDNAPQFIRLPYHAAVSEGSPTGTQVIRIAAVDADDGINGNIKYSIINGNNDGVFQIDDITGQITVSKSLDRETIARYTLTVMARDMGEDVSHNTTALVGVDILDENDNVPKFDNSTTRMINISENAPVGSRIFIFSATDSDLGVNAEVTFSVASGNFKETFRIDGPSGDLFLVRPLDYEDKNNYILNVSASDGGTPRLATTLQIVVKVLDVNDNAPRFSSTAVVRQIEESIPANTPVVTLTAQDRDSGINGKIIFNISHQEPPGKHFAIQPETGVLYTTQVIDREYSDTFRLTVVATDQAKDPSMRLSVEKTVTIIVEDINDNAPTFVSMDAGVLPGHIEKGYKIMTLSASDPDANNNGIVTYELEGGDSALFALNKLTGDLYTARAIDRPSVTYTLTVKATDQAVVSVRKSSRNKVTIIGTLRNSEGPVFGSAEYTGSVLENKPVGTSVLSVGAKYPHGQSEKQVEYFLTAVTNAAGAPQSRVFAINRFSGVISTASVLDREGGARMFYLDVYAVDTAAQSPKTSKAKVTITVTDSNDSPPVFDANPYKVSLSENAIAGHTVITVSASDPDTEGSLTYILVDEKQDEKFRLDPLTGALYLSQPLDRESQDIHKVRIRADDGVQYSETLLIIEVSDSNDNSPVFDHSVYSFDIIESTQRGAQAGFVSATDADIGVNKQISYLVLSDWGNDVFSLNPQSGVFTLTSHLDYEQMQHYIFVVQAQDSGNPSLSSTVTVYFNVVDLNDNAPLFDPMSYSDEVFENITIGTSILRVSATDMDSGDNGCIIYNIIGGNAGNRFAINTDGAIFTAKILDRETQSFYSLTISATDQALPVEKRLSSTVQVSVILKDVNDMAPEFVTPNETSVLENVPRNTVVMAVKAIDKDEGRNSYIEYSLASQTNKFSLGPIDGLLRAVGPLDREQKSEYKVTVIAKDRGHPPQSTTAEVTIHILDENDNSPAFLHRQYSATVSENTSVGLSILQVFASDVDEGLNGQVRYSIIAGDLNHDFVIDQDTGIIRVSKNLDYERKSHYVLTIQAEDSGVDIRHDTASVAIAVTDVNDNPPTFHDSPYIIHVMENAQSLPVSLMIVMAYDSDQITNNELQYLIKDGNRSVFSINPNTGELSVQKSLDREQQAEYSLTVICIDSGSPRQTGTGSIKIIVDDINDNQPQFAFKEYSTSIMENLPPLSPVITIKASDRDSGRNAQIRYSLVGDHGGRFEVDPDTGTISTSTILDREERELYNMLLVAQDSGLIIQHKAVTNITITVEDENDNKPEFAESNYNVYTPDNAGGGLFAFGAVAIDFDARLNSRLVYHLSGTDADKFQINQDTGVVKLVQKLVNKSEGYELEIHATDSGQVPLSSTTIVNVYTHRHHLFPRFHPGPRSFNFAESSENMLVTRVTATSPKINEAGKLMYYIAGGNSGNAFTVSTEMGEVRLVGGLDRETISSYELWVGARDSDTPSLSSAVKLEILVTDVNDNAPIFEKSVYNATVKEELEPPLFVIHVQAFDADYDVNGDVEYRLDTSETIDLPFSLDSKTGKIHTTEILDRETKDQYRIIIKAVDHGTPQRTSSAIVYIKVLDKNDNPPRFTRLFSANVTENAAIGTFIIQVTSSDKDINMNANATYSFTENPGGKFHIDPVSGNVTVAGWLDREVKDEYLLKVAAVDGSWQAETPLTVLIQDVNDNVPEFGLSEYTFNIPELMQGVSFIGQVSATDRDKKGPDSFVSYSLKRPSDLFRIDPNSGNILSKQVLYYKRTLKGSSPENKHVIQVVASDHGNPPLSSEVTVIINVIDSNNNAPTFQKDFYFSPIPESAAIGLSVLQVVAEDKEDVGINAVIEYQKTGGNGSHYFAVHKQTGWVTVSNPLVGLKEEWFSINVQATDKGVPARSTDVVGMFAITEENHFAPAFTALSYQVVIPENEPLLSEIVTVTATDEDKGFNGEIIYSILSGNEESQFKISAHTGAITIAKHLDFESVTTYHLNIQASDRGFRSKNSTAVLTVLVTDVNDNPPTFNSSSIDVYIAENEPPGSFVTQLIAHDADSIRNSVIEYSVMDGDDHSFFEINSKTGVITSKVSFDYEQKSKYIVQVIASNVGTLLFSSTTVNIHIAGKNEFYPHFIQPVFQFTVSESAGVGTTVGQLQAVDDDSGIDGEVFFLLVGSSNNKGFQIDTKTGSIKVSRILDRESQSRVVLTVLAKNAGSIRGNDTDEAQIVISIQDGNDPPVFSKEIYESRVSEAAPIGTSVVSVSAVDKDVHPNNNQFSFSILSGNIDKAFNIDPQSGAIYTAEMLDRETYDVYNLTVTATDSGNPPQSGSTQVKIYIDDVNDNGPIFETPKVIGYVLENELPYTSIMVLSVTDKDLPPNGAPFKFFLVGGEHKDYFEVETNTGLVKTVKSLDRESIPELELIVEIEDSGKPPMKSQHPVTIMVLDKNDSPSTSRPLTVLVWIHNRNFLGGKIADVHPQDLDTVGQYQCQIVEGNTAIFRISKKCDLHTSKLKNPGNYTLTVSGNDGKHHNVSSIIRVVFLNFDNATLQNSISLRIWNFSADVFLSTNFDHLQRVLKDILKPVGVPVIYSIVNIEEHLEITLASKTSDSSYVPPQDILILLSDKISFIRESLQDKDLVIGFNPCEISPCQNKGICSSFLQMKDSLFIVNSPSRIFTSPFVARQFSCQCPRGFSGSVCQYQQDPCLPNPCLSGGTCHQDGITFRCTCIPQFEGEKCDTPRKESCSSAPCKNGGTCQEAPNGGFFCLCRPGFKGLVCEQTADACRPNRCLNGGTCVSENLGYHCVCTSSYFGRHCEKSSYGFHPFSYMAFNPLQPTTNDISIVFSTNNPNALLVYNYGTQSGGRSDFLALEIINSTPTLSFGGSRTAITRISANIIVSDGKWHKVTIIRNGKVASVSVVNCNENGDTCEECLLGNSTCSKSATGHTGTLNFNGNLLYVGGVPTVDPLLERPGQVSSNDFVGCLRGLSVNGRQTDMGSPLKSAFVSSTCTRKEGSCTVSTCGEGTTCIDNWFSTSCRCAFGMLASSCAEAQRPYGIGSGTFIELVPQEKHRRTLLFTDRIKDTTPKTVSFILRTFSQNGIIMHSGADDERTVLQLIKGKLVYSSKVKFMDQVIEELGLPLLSDGQWHAIKMSYHQNKYPQVNISVDNSWQSIKSKEMQHDFLDPYISSITIGGQWEHLSGEEQFHDILGCIKIISINDEVQLHNFSGYFSLFIHGNSHSLCQTEAIGIDNAAPTDPLSIGVILVIVFFVILLIVILISFLVFRRRKLKRDKSSVQKQNGNAFLTSASGDPHRALQCAGYTETTPAGDEIRNHMPQDLVPKKLKDRDPHTECPNRPDIIEREIHNKPSPAFLRMEEPPPHNQEKAQNNFVMQNNVDLEPLEHYDLENSSSIAPSDIDVVYHYKGFRDGNIHKYKPNPQVPSYHKHNHRHSPHQFQANPVRESPRNILHQSHNPLTQKRESPSSIKMQNTPLARLSPSSELSQQTPRILTLEDISGKPLQKALLATAQGVGSKQFQDPMTNSDRSLNSPVSNLSHSTSSMQSGPQNVSKLKTRDNSMTLGLTTEEIERLNTRPRNLSLVSTLDAVSSSSDDNAGKHKLAELLESNTELLEAQDSSTDESGNDSFTCSEFEYDNYDKVHREFGPRNMIFSKLAEEDNENDEDYAKNYDRFDSFRGSFSTLVASDDESSNPPPYKPTNGSMLGWDCLLNWGPNFENLVGVFKDIEQLPDNVNSSCPGHSQTDEDYI